VRLNLGEVVELELDASLGCEHGGGCEHHGDSNLFLHGLGLGKLDEDLLEVANEAVLVGDFESLHACLGHGLAALVNFLERAA